MSKDSKNTVKKFISILRTILIIALIAIAAYSIMAVITHFSLNFELENYKFKDSILSIFNTETAIFKFFIGFMILNIVWLIIAVSIYSVKKFLFRNKYE